MEDLNSHNRDCIRDLSGTGRVGIHESEQGNDLGWYRESADRCLDRAGNGGRRCRGKF